MNRGQEIRGLWKPAIAIAALLGAAAVLQAQMDVQTRSQAKQDQELLVTSPALLKKVSLGYDPLLADIYWTRAVQYFGSRVTEPQARLDQLPALLNITTTLDPHMVIAYRFGAVFLSEKKPGRTDLAVDLVKRGIAKNPDAWRLYFDLGFLYYWRLKDYQNAAKAYLDGSEVPGAPVFMKLMAAQMARKGGSFETAEMVFGGLYSSSSDPNVREFALHQLQIVKAQKDQSKLNNLIDQYRERTKHNPTSIRDLIETGLLRGAPLDPAGYPYLIGTDGRSHLDPRSPIKPTER